VGQLLSLIDIIASIMSNRSDSSRSSQRSSHKSSHGSSHRSSHKSSNKNNSKSQMHISKDICVDSLFPTETKSGERGKRLDVETIFTNTPLNNEPEIIFTSDILLERIHKRRLEKLKYYKTMLSYCQKKISETDSNHGTDIVVSIVESFPECKNYNPSECLEYISNKLREEDIDTFILSDTSIFITWHSLELKKEQNKLMLKERELEKERREKIEKEERLEKERQRHDNPERYNGIEF
jgi:hypothetical protein